MKKCRKREIEARRKRRKAQLEGERTDVTQEEYKERLKVCLSNKCGKFKEEESGQMKCLECNCMWKKNLRWTTQGCYLGYFNEIV